MNWWKGVYKFVSSDDETDFHHDVVEHEPMIVITTQAYGKHIPVLLPPKREKKYVRGNKPRQTKEVKRGKYIVDKEKFLYSLKQNGLI